MDPGLTWQKVSSWVPLRSIKFSEKSLLGLFFIGYSRFLRVLSFSRTPPGVKIYVPLVDEILPLDAGRLGEQLLHWVCPSISSGWGADAILCLPC